MPLLRVPRHMHNACKQKRQQDGTIILWLAVVLRLAVFHFLQVPSPLGWRRKCGALSKHYRDPLALL